MFKEALRSIYKQAKTSYHARIAFHRWCRLAEETQVPELQTMAGTIRDKMDGIVSFWTFRRISNAPMEGFNNKIRWLIRQAYGFWDREYNKIENLPITGDLLRERTVRLCHKPSKRHILTGDFRRMYRSLMAEREGFDKERSDEEREPQANATLPKKITPRRHWRSCIKGQKKSRCKFDLQSGIF